MSEPFDHPERIGQVFQIEVTTEFSGCDPVIGDVLRLDQLFFNAGIGADVSDIISFFFLKREKSDVWRDMTCRAAPGEDDLLHKRNVPPLSSLFQGSVL